MGNDVVARKSKFTGVSWHKGNANWRASIYAKGKHVHLINSGDQELCAWCVDFARYLIFGPDPSTYHHRCGSPNGPPRHRYDIARNDILRIILNADVVPFNLLEERRDLFDAAATANEAALA